MRLRALLLTSALFLFSASLFGADVTGKWTYHVKFFLGSGDPWFQFQQTGEKLTGMYHGRFGDFPLNGSVKGNQIEFTIQEKSDTAVYTGTLTGDSVKGTAKYPRPVGTGHFEGKRTP